MARKSKDVKPPEQVRAHNYKVLLYADNPDHMRTLALIRSYRHKSGGFEYCGIWHIEKDENGLELLSGEHKKHAHLLLHFDSAQRWLPLCARFHISERFFRPIGYDNSGETLEKGYIYLTHYRYPEKTQFSPHDIFGTWSAREKAIIANLRVAAAGLSMQDCVFAITLWIEKQEGVITQTQLLRWVRTYTPYFKGLQHKLVYRVLDEHNAQVRMRQNSISISLSDSENFREVTPAEYDYFEERIYYG